MAAKDFKGEINCNSTEFVCRRRSYVYIHSAGIIVIIIVRINNVNVIYRHWR